MHFLYFDGTSYFIGDESDKTDNETTVIRKSSNFKMLDELCDKLNEEVFPTGS
jgi:hypothetical protein